MQTCPHCETSLEEPSASSLENSRTWDGICSCCGRSIYESHDHAAETAPPGFNSQQVGQRALDLLEKTAETLDHTILPDWGSPHEQRANLASIWSHRDAASDASLTIKWKSEDSGRLEKTARDDASVSLKLKTQIPEDISHLKTQLPGGDTEQNDSSALLTFAPESKSNGATEPLDGSVSTGRSLSIRPRSLSHDPAKPTGNSDYELLEKLGQGGMGVVYKARQASIDRNVAVKMVKTANVSEKQRKSFVSEAVITGELDHPNIVPIYDLGTDEAGALFYSMKEVKGTPWKDVIREKTQAENLDILLRVADAVAFAHSRGVVHCDLKPENVMLGDFGEVLVMDWGLAQLLPEFQKPREIAKSAEGGGTPAYMAPEMAAGHSGLIQVASDVYLLGAILYEIITGRPPHTGRSVMDCLVNVARNIIQPTDKSGELLDIAYHAMQTEPKQRYLGVPEFQAAIRTYQSHSESTRLSDRAASELTEAQEKQDYELFAQALAAFRESLSLWSENTSAEEGLFAARLAYAECAHRKGDYDLGLSLLDQNRSEQAELFRKIQRALYDRDARQQRLRRTKRLVAALGMLMIVGTTIAVIVINEARKEAQGQREIAEHQAIVAEEQRGIAQEQTNLARNEKLLADQERQKAEKARDDAVIQKSKAERARQSADAARKLEEAAKLAAQHAESEAVAARKAEVYEAYVAQIQLAAAKIEENAFDTARRLLEECRPLEGEEDLRGWEWWRLMHLCHQSERNWQFAAPVESVAFSPDGSRFVSAAWDGHARVFDLETGNELFALQHQGQYVHAAKFSPDGRYIVTGSNDPTGFVRLWNAETGEPLKSFFGHQDAVLSVRFSQDGRRLVTTSYDNTARLWDVDTGEELKKFEGHFWWVWSAAFSPDEKHLVTASHDGTASVYEVATGKKIADFTGHKGPVFAAEFSPDGQTIASGGFDHRILIWKPEDQPSTNLQLLTQRQSQARTPVFTALDDHRSGVRSVEFSRDGRKLLSGSDDNSLKLWSVDTKRTIETLRGHHGWIAKAALSPDGQWAISASHDQQVRLWNLSGYEETRVLGGHVLNGHGDAVLNAAVSRDGQFIATASRDRTAKLWSAATGKELKTFSEGHSFLSMRACFSPDGRWLFTAAFDNTVRLWNVAHGTEVARLEHTGRNAALAVSPDGQFLVTGSDDDTAKVWILSDILKAGASQLEPKPQWTLNDHRREITAVAVSKDGRWIYTGDAKGRGRLWDQTTGELRHRLDGHAEAITSAAFLPDGSRVLTASRDRSVGQWDVATGQELRGQILKHSDDVTSLALLPDGQRLVTSCDDKTVRLWNLKTQEIETILYRGDDIQTVDVSPDGKLALGLSSVEGRIRIWHLDTGREWTMRKAGNVSAPFFQLTSETDSLWSATFSPDNHGLLTVAGNDVRLWNLATQEVRMSFNPHGAVSSAEFSPDGQRLVTAGWDHTARIWNLQTGKAEQKLHGQHTADINRAVFSPNGRYVLTASDDGTAVLWDLEKSEPERVFQGHTKRINSAAFSRDGRWVLTASDDRTARVWDAKTGTELLVLSGHAWSVRSAEFSGDSDRIITASDDNTAIVWRIRRSSPDGQSPWNAEKFLVLSGHSAAVVAGGFSPDGRRVVTGSRDDTAIIWDAETGKELLTLKGHTQDIASARFSEDGRHVLTGSRDGTAVLWLTTKAEGR